MLSFSTSVSSAEGGRTVEGRFRPRANVSHEGFRFNRRIGYTIRIRTMSQKQFDDLFAISAVLRYPDFDVRILDPTVIREYRCAAGAIKLLDRFGRRRCGAQHCTKSKPQKYLAILRLTAVIVILS